MTPTTREEADAVYTLKGNRADARAEQTSVGKVITTGSGLTGSFVQTNTVSVSLKGAFENCPDAPIDRTYTGVQKLEAATVPGGGPGQRSPICGRQPFPGNSAAPPLAPRDLNPEA